MLKSPVSLTNSLSTDEMRLEAQQVAGSHYNTTVSNSFFHFSQHHKFLAEAIRGFDEYYDGDWASAGPQLFTSVNLAQDRTGFWIK